VIPERDWADCDPSSDPRDGCVPATRAALQSPEGDWADCDTSTSTRRGCTSASDRSCNPPKGIRLIATTDIPLVLWGAPGVGKLQSPEGDWADCVEEKAMADQVVIVVDG